MRIQVISDLHLEFAIDDWRKPWKELIGSVICQDAHKTTLVVAGDLCPAVQNNLSMMKYAFDTWSKAYEYIFYVAGNHEYYSSNPRDKANKIKANIHRAIGERRHNVNFLDNKATSFFENNAHAATFFGGTMWGDFISDQTFIPGLKNFTHVENVAFRQHLEHHNPDIVISHHLPSMDIVHPSWRNSSLNSYFVSEHGPWLCKEEKAPLLWICGHTHNQISYKLGETGIFANPRGYPHEQSALNWNPHGCILDVDFKTRKIIKLEK